MQHLFLQIKKTKEFTCYIHEYLAKVMSIPLLRIHDNIRNIGTRFQSLGLIFQVHICLHVLFMCNDYVVVFILIICLSDQDMIKFDVFVFQAFDL